MKHLIIIRHAKSDWDHPGLTDFERPLNKRGRLSAPFMGEFLKSNKPMPDQIICSAAKRTRETCELLTHGMGIREEVSIAFKKEIYGADVSDLLEVVNKIGDDIEVTFLIGHNPGVSDVTHYLTNDDNAPSFTTCGVAHITFDTDSWAEVSAGTGTFIDYHYPRQFPKFNELLKNQ